MPDYMPTEDGGRIRVPDGLVEARRADSILVQPEGEGVVVTVFADSPDPAGEPDGATAEVVAHFFMPRASFERWANSLPQTFDLWRERGV